MNKENIKTISLDCPSCGGKMEPTADGKKIVCPYCGHTALIEKDTSAQKEYDRLMARAKADEDIRDLKEKRQRRRRNLPLPKTPGPWWISTAARAPSG